MVQRGDLSFEPRHEASVLVSWRALEHPRYRLNILVRRRLRALQGGVLPGLRGARRADPDAGGLAARLRRVPPGPDPSGARPTGGGDDPPPAGCGGPSLASAGEGVLPRAGFDRRARRPNPAAFCGRPGRVVTTIRLVFQFPASITSVVEAPRLVSSDASPTRPEWAVTRASPPAARAGGVNRSHLQRERAAFGGRGRRRRPFTKPHVPHLALLVSSCRGGRVTSPRRPRSRATLVGLDPAAALAGRSTGSRPGPGRCVPRLGSAHGRGEPGSTPRPPPSRRSPGLVELGEVGGEGRALEPPTVEPSVEADDRKASGQPRVVCGRGRNPTFSPPRVTVLRLQDAKDLLALLPQLALITAFLGDGGCCCTCGTRSAPATSGWRGPAATATSERRCCRLPPSLMPTAACRLRPVPHDLARRAPVR